MPNIRPKISFFTLGFAVFLITFSPQKVKNIDTFCPVVAAPLASTKVASALSRSSLNMISVLALPPPAARTVHVSDEPFSMTTVYFPLSSDLYTNLLPVVLHHACASRENPASVATISIRSPSEIKSIACLIFITGPGHCNPQASIRTVLTCPSTRRVSTPVVQQVSTGAIVFTIGAVAVA